MDDDDDWPIVSNVMIENRINHRATHHHRSIVHSTNELLIRSTIRLDIADFHLQKITTPTLFILQTQNLK